MYLVVLLSCNNRDLPNKFPYKEFNGKISPLVKIELNSAFSVYDVYGVKLLSRLRFTFSHLNEHKVHHSFKDETYYTCNCGSATEKT